MPTNRLLSAFAASLIALAPAHAFAQPEQEPVTERAEGVSVRDRPRPEYDAPGRRLGTFVLNAALDLEYVSTDNLFADGIGAELDDTIFAVSPYVHLGSDWSRHALEFEAGAMSNQHEEFDNEDADTHYLRAAGRLDVARTTRINASARSAHQVTPRTDPDFPSVGFPIEYDRMDYAAGIEHDFARFSVRLEGGVSEYDYEGAQTFRDYEETVLRGRIEAPLTPRVGLVLQATTDERDYPNTPTLDSEGETYMVGFNFEGNLFNGELIVGQFEREYAGAGVGDFDGMAARAEIEWYATELTTFTFDARRDADDQVSANVGLPYLTTEYGLRVDHELLRNLILFAAGRSGNREYDSIDRDDEYTEIDVGAQWMLNPHAALRFELQRNEVNSTGAVAYRDYEVNRGLVGLTLRL